jgi:predicted dinucleotide-binding enzyme
MRIVTIGNGSVGGGLARLWTTAGHDVTALGSEGGDASDAEAIVVAVPGGAIRDALAKVKGIEGKPTVDATNSLSGPPAGYPSLTAQVKSIVGGPTIKAFNTNFAMLYGQISQQRVAPHSVFASDAEARPLAERLIGDAGFQPLYVGDLSAAPTLEAQIAFTMLLGGGEVGPYFYRFATVDL